MFFSNLTCFSLISLTKATDVQLAGRYYTFKCLPPRPTKPHQSGSAILSARAPPTYIFTVKGACPPVQLHEAVAPGLTDDGDTIANPPSDLSDCC